jgi:mono/diheme cytochrome c family protein
MRRRSAALCALAALLIPAAAAAETLLERGAYLMRSIVACGNCHTPGSLEGRPDTKREMAGGVRFDEPPFTAYAPNLTPDPETGLGKWTDVQIVAAIREGRRPDGSIIGPPMPIELYRGISDRDAHAIVAYLRNLKPIRNRAPKSVYRIPLPPAYGPPVGSVPEAPRGDRLRYGAYLAGPLGHCTECHTPMTAPGRRDFANQLGAGGFPLIGAWGTSFSANITPDKETGIGEWTDAELKRAITQGLRRDGDKMYPPMAYHFYKNIAAEDLDAIVGYLRSLKPIRKDRERRFTPPGR